MDRCSGWTFTRRQGEWIFTSTAFNILKTGTEKEFTPTPFWKQEKNRRKKRSFQAPGRRTSILAGAAQSARVATKSFVTRTQNPRVFRGPAGLFLRLCAGRTVCEPLGMLLHQPLYLAPLTHEISVAFHDVVPNSGRDSESWSVRRHSRSCCAKSDFS